MVSEEKVIEFIKLEMEKESPLNMDRMFREYQEKRLELSDKINEIEREKKWRLAALYYATKTIEMGKTYQLTYPNGEYQRVLCVGYDFQYNHLIKESELHYGVRNITLKKDGTPSKKTSWTRNIPYSLLLRCTIQEITRLS